MNGFKHLSVQLCVPENVQDVLKTAYLCARKFNGHLDVVHVKPDASCILPFPVVSSEMAGFVVSDIVSVEEAVCEKNAVEIEKEFHRFVRDNQVLLKTRPEPDGKPSADFRRMEGNVEENAVWLSRVSDLTVLPRPNTAQTPAGDTFSVLNAVLMETGAAVLLPAINVEETLGTKIAVEWNGTAEAAKAVTLGMPFLRKAQKIVIFETADLPECGNAQALKTLLAWNGVDAQIETLERSLLLGSPLCEAISDGFDLLVMGAYTQSSMRRWILGSTTRYIIDNADIALLLAH